MNATTTELAVTKNGHEPTAARALQGATAQLFLTPRTLPEAIQLAEIFARSNLFAVKKADEALTILLTGLELGLGAAQAMRSISVIQGKATLNAEAMLALCRSRTNICKYFQLIESTTDVATYETWRIGAPSPTQMSFTVGMAKDAGLLNNPTWTKYRATMLRWRCISMLVKESYSDICLGLYTPEELGQAEAELEGGHYERRQRESAVYIDGTTGEVIESPAARVYTAEEKTLIREINAGLQALTGEYRDRALEIRRAYGVKAVGDMEIDQLQPFKASVIGLLQKQADENKQQEEPAIDGVLRDGESEPDPFAEDGDKCYVCEKVLTGERPAYCYDNDLPIICAECEVSENEANGQQGLGMDVPPAVVAGPDAHHDEPSARSKARR